MVTGWCFGTWRRMIFHVMGWDNSSMSSETHWRTNSYFSEGSVETTNQIKMASWLMMSSGIIWVIWDSATQYVGEYHYLFLDCRQLFDCLFGLCPPQVSVLGVFFEAPWKLKRWAKHWIDPQTPYDNVLVWHMTYDPLYDSKWFQIVLLNVI